MSDKTPRVDKTRWRADAKNILSDLRIFQDAITEKYGYEGFLAVRCTVNGIVAGKLVSLVYQSSDDGVNVSLIEDDTLLDSINLPHQGA